ncbi:acetyl/propionyl/methylcrotonyl-CoA carboxylase subunit alpha [Rhodococcus opacus]|uniref:acetyl/propionyl/methylcrotonyl-CoA carboxylase subunit alpha n=1 Tax=Rhodococcus opacus TaxID=37919 RepID=UPI001C46F439|nr:biotin carboxylase N-terminal domain-containing protein [Rhodococcus opacus]MBV6759058.1 ATP-grasp domain-containing protein [Rhodococcus opacus]
MKTEGIHTVGTRLSKLLIANRGEIAVRIIRACKDAGIRTVAIYADPDRDALFVRLADEAYPLNGEAATDTYLSIEKVLEAAVRSGADSVHPGYGFLSENSEFAQAVIDAGLVWVGPPPAAIDQLGDKVKARQIAQRVGAPLVPGTPGPVKGLDEVIAFANEYGMPIAIKAAFGGGGRGLKIAHEIDQIPSLYESAVREATLAFGRGECFVERFVEKPRHVETQLLADSHGNVVVVSTRDCTLQRRHQKLVEEAPAPFLSVEQTKSLYESSKAIFKEVGYIGAGTCEFLVGADGAISFLEVNTRLQVEHPVSEEVTGLDLVREMLRIAAGEELGYDDPEILCHAIEFRINAEDPGREFLPSPGTLAQWEPPSGPGVRLDAGYVQGETIPRHFDSLIAKLIVTGTTREQALERSRRALAEFAVDGTPTVIPFHRSVVDDPAFIAADGSFDVYTTWIEDEYNNQIEPYAGKPVDNEPDTADELIVEFDGRRRKIRVLNRGSRSRPVNAGPSHTRITPSSSNTSAQAVVMPMQGNVVKVAVENGQTVSCGDLIVVVEAMKMELPVAAHRDGRISGLNTKVGDAIQSGFVIATITDVD